MNRKKKRNTKPTDAEIKIDLGRHLEKRITQVVALNLVDYPDKKEFLDGEIGSDILDMIANVCRDVIVAEMQDMVNDMVMDCLIELAEEGRLKAKLEA